MTSPHLEIFDVPQRSDEWRQIRLGLATASEFSTLLASGKGGGESIGRKKLLYRLAGEILTGEPGETYENDSMRRGRAMEAEALELYQFVQGVEATKVGFLKRHDLAAGCSPDGLIGDEGQVEIKTAKPEVLIDLLLRDQFPAEHRAQVQGSLWISQRKWCDLVVYWPGLPLLIKRSVPDHGYIANLAGGVKRFNEELQQTIEKIRCYKTLSKEPQSTFRESLEQTRERIVQGDVSVCAERKLPF